MESELTLERGPIPAPDERFMDFRISFRPSGPGVRIFAKWPAMEAFVEKQMEKDYGVPPTTANYLIPSKVIKNAYIYQWSGRVNFVPAWGGPAISYREKDPLWSGDGTYFNVWWCLVKGLKDGISWDMRFPPDADHMEGYAKHLSSFAREFGDRMIRPYDISLVVNMKVMR